MFDSQPKQEIDALMDSDVAFRQLFYKHRELDKKIVAAGLGVLPIGDVQLAQLKREKLYAKDRLTRIYHQRQH